jgi:hypothetical protein
MFLPHPPTMEASPHLWTSTCVPRPTLARCHDASRPRVGDLSLRFSVSLDEEFVRLEMACGGRVVDLGSRSHNYLLLTLARRRLEDAAAGVSPSSSGWIHTDELAHDPSLVGPRLNIDVFRIRRKFMTLGLSDAEAIIERRQRANQLRIGTDRVDVVRI